MRCVSPQSCSEPRRRGRDENINGTNPLPGMDLLSHNRICYSAACQENLRLQGKNGTCSKCYSSVCRGAKPSLWKHPKLRSLLLRAKICCAWDNMEARMQPFSSFAPRLLHDYIRRLAEAEQHGEGEYLPYGEVHTGAVLLADASGFTKLTERLSKKSNGAEILCGVLNDFFEVMVNIVHRFGGDVIKYAGDAIMVLWIISDSRGSPTTMRDATIQATQCALAIHKRLHNFPAIEDTVDPVLLTLHIGVGCGQFTSFHVGGVFDRWEFVVGGRPMRSQVAIAEPAADSGETVVSPEVWDIIKDIADGTVLRDLAGPARAVEPEALDFIRVDRFKEGLTLPPRAYNVVAQATDLEYLRRYIPAAVHKRLEAGHDAYIAEIRQVSIVFIKVGGISIEADDSGASQGTDVQCMEAIAVGQELMLQIQEIIYQAEGSVNKMMIDDKGQVILCVFGLNPYYHHDDPVRAVRSSMHVVQRLQRLREGVSVAVGVASGKSFCGVVGSRERREYTVMGRMVNLAARLMAQAADNTVLVDAATHEKAKMMTGIEFTALEPILFKGFATPQVTYQPMRSNKGSPAKQIAMSAKLAHKYRANERDKIYNILHDNRLTGIVLVITGDRGSGKTAVYEATMQIGKDDGLYVLNSNIVGKSKSGINPTFVDPVADPLKISAQFAKPTFSTWSQVFTALVAKGCIDEGMTKEEYVTAILGDDPHIALLCIVIPELKFAPPPKTTSGTSDEPTDANADMNKSSGNTPPVLDSAASEALKAIPYWELTLEQRVIRMTDMLTQCLSYFSKTVPTLLVLHVQTGTSHKLAVDPESWFLAQVVADKLCNPDRPKNYAKLVLCLINRPSVYYSPPELLHIERVAQDRRTLVSLKPLNSQHRVTYLAEYLKVDLASIPTQLVDFLSNYGAGNPKHIEEIVNKLRDDGIIIVENRSVRMCTSPGKTEKPLGMSVLPPKTTGAAMTTLERMQEKHTLVIKIASFWDKFTDLMLKDLVPYRNERDELPQILATLVDSGILDMEPVPQALRDYHPNEKHIACYSFVSKVVQQQANGLLLEQKRRDIQLQIDALEKKRKANRLYARQREEHAEIMSTVRDKMAVWLGISGRPSKKHSLGDASLARMAKSKELLRRRAGARAAARRSMHPVDDDGQQSSPVAPERPGALVDDVSSAVLGGVLRFGSRGDSSGSLPMSPLSASPSGPATPRHSSGSDAAATAAPTGPSAQSPISARSTSTSPVGFSTPPHLRSLSDSPSRTDRKRSPGRPLVPKFLVGKVVQRGRSSENLVLHRKLDEAKRAQAEAQELIASLQSTVASLSPHKTSDTSGADSSEA